MILKPPAISIIIPCYNYGLFLPETLQSLIKQSFLNWECILVANGSDRETKKVIESYANNDKRFLIISTENHGPSAARNAGLDLATGKYIQFLDADDKLEASRFEIMINAFEKDEGIDILYSKVRYFTNENTEIQLLSINDLSAIPKENYSGTQRAYYNILINRNIFTINTPLVRRDAINIRFDENYEFLEDWDFWLRLAPEIRRFKFLPEPETYALVRYHSNSHSRNKKGMISASLPIVISNLKLSFLNSSNLLLLLCRISIQTWTLISTYGIQSFLKIRLRPYQKFLMIVLLPFSLPLYIIYNIKLIHSR